MLVQLAQNDCWRLADSAIISGLTRYGCLCKLRITVHSLEKDAIVIRYTFLRLFILQLPYLLYLLILREQMKRWVDLHLLHKFVDEQVIILSFLIASG